MPRGSGPGLGDRGSVYRDDERFFWFPVSARGRVLLGTLGGGMPLGFVGMLASRLGARRARVRLLSFSGRSDELERDRSERFEDFREASGDGVGVRVSGVARGFEGVDDHGLTPVDQRRDREPRCDRGRDAGDEAPNGGHGVVRVESRAEEFRHQDVADAGEAPRAPLVRVSGTRVRGLVRARGGAAREGDRVRRDGRGRPHRGASSGTLVGGGAGERGEGPESGREGRRTRPRGGGASSSSAARERPRREGQRAREAGRGEERPPARAREAGVATGGGAGHRARRGRAGARVRVGDGARASEGERGRP